MPKKAVGLFFLCAFIGAALYIYLTFPRTKEEIPTSNNQRPFPSAPLPSAPAPGSVPVPETVPQPNTPTPPKLPPGPTLRVMAWADAQKADTLSRLKAQVDGFTAACGRPVMLSISTSEAAYAHDLQQALANDTPPDVCLVAARDFSGLDPAQDLVDVKPDTSAAQRSLAAFTVDQRVKVVPDEFSVDVLFFHPAYFDQAGIGYPGPHWNWDILEADARALASLKLKDPAGQPVYPLELPADFDLWNILCTQAGHPALDLGTWHLTDHDTKETQMRALDFIHEIFQQLAVTAPLPKPGEAAGQLFAQQRAALLIGPSDLMATLPQDGYQLTVLPSDMQRASLARVNGWGVLVRSQDKDAARALAAYLAQQPVHTGWTSAHVPVMDDDGSPVAVCYEALSQALVPRIGPKSARMAAFLDQQIGLLARDGAQKTDDLYARIQNEYQGDMLPPTISGELPEASGQKPTPKIDAAGLRGL